MPSLPTADSTTVSAPAAQAAPPEFGDTGTSTTPAEHEDLFGDGSLISFGIPLEDRQAKRFTIRVFVLAVSIASFSLIHFIVNLLTGSYSDGGQVGSTNEVWSSLSGLLIELSIPASGYMGALYHNRQLTCCFCSCNLFLAVLSIASFTRLVIRLFEVNGNCDLESDDSQRALCEMWLDNGVDKYVFLVNLMCSSTLSCCAFWAGNMLFQKLSPEPPNFDDRPIVGEVVQLSTAIPNLMSVGSSGSTTPGGQVMTLYTVDRSSRSRSRSESDLQIRPSPSGPSQRTSPTSSPV